MGVRTMQRPPSNLIVGNHRPFRPLLRACGLGFLSYLSPRLFSLLLSKATRKGKNRDVSPVIIETLRRSIEIHRFPAFCGVTIGGWQLLQPVFEAILEAGKDSALKNLDARERRTAATFLASSVSAAGALQLLNSRSCTGPAGRTLDLTLFAVVRALDVIVGEFWSRWKTSRASAGNFSKLEAGLGQITDAAVFSLSAGVIMFSWFYFPERLPSAYRKWITEISEADSRLMQALSRIRTGEFVYGKDTGQASLLGTFCEELGLPQAWGDPAQCKAIPCEIVHSGVSKSCEVHAIWRFWKTFKAAFPMYLGLNALGKMRKPSLGAFVRALKDSARSSAFLGTFVSILWYVVCLTRMRIGPKIFPRVDQLLWDTLCVKLGCVLCGWSILIERPQRRGEIAFFVAPRALAALLPRKYDRKYRFIETFVFGLSTGVVMTAIKQNPQRVRGVFGKVLRRVMAP